MGGFSSPLFIPLVATSNQIIIRRAHIAFAGCWFSDLLGVTGFRRGWDPLFGLRLGAWPSRFATDLAWTFQGAGIVGHILAGPQRPGRFNHVGTWIFNLGHGSVTVGPDGELQLLPPPTMVVLLVSRYNPSPMVSF